MASDLRLSPFFGSRSSRSQLQLKLTPRPNGIPLPSQTLRTSSDSRADARRGTAEAASTRVRTVVVVSATTRRAVVRSLVGQQSIAMISEIRTVQEETGTGNVKAEGTHTATDMTSPIGSSSEPGSLDDR